MEKLKPHYSELIEEIEEINVFLEKHQRRNTLLLFSDSKPTDIKPKQSVEQFQPAAASSSSSSSAIACSSRS